jgi:2-polyprenyl-3-methyl-5-hydroxy-6-metoxy-1,4-benzoquinol methylase
MRKSVRNKLRKLRWNLAKASAMNSKWFRAIGECQKEIATSNPNPYYLQAYRDAEIWYWYHVPKWIAQLTNESIQVNKVLDIGGAYGTLALYCKHLFDCEIFMTDLTGSYLSDTLKCKNEINFSVSNIELDPLPWQHQFEIIIFTEVIEHLNFNPKPTLIKIRERLTDKGELFLTTPDAAEWGRKTDYFESLDSIPSPSVGRPIIDNHVWQYSKKELIELFTVSGFRIEKFNYAPGTPNRHFNFQLAKR